MADDTLYEVRNGAAWITLNRPHNRNALSAVLVNELYTHLATAQADPNVRAIVITGAGPTFCAGADLKNPPGSVVDGTASVPFQDILTRILESETPVIAAVNGAAFAGGLGHGVAHCAQGNVTRGRDGRRVGRRYVLGRDRTDGTWSNCPSGGNVESLPRAHGHGLTTTRWRKRHRGLGYVELHSRARRLRHLELGHPLRGFVREKH